MTTQAASPPPDAPTPGRRLLRACRAHPARATLAALGLLLALAVALADTLLAGPMRTWAERMINGNLKGYTVHIGRVKPHLWRLAFDLDDLVLTQDSHPQPPVADFAALQFSLAWGELLHLKAAGKLTLLRPALHLNLAQLQDEAQSEVSLKDRGWQKAVESVYPIKLDRVMVLEGSLLYLSPDPTSKPLQLTGIRMEARNVRNIAAAKGTYPSPVTLDAMLFDTGHVLFKGDADFLREPYSAAKGELHLVRVPLDRLDPLAAQYQMRTHGGLLSLNGTLEYTPETQTAHLKEVLLENLRADYVTSQGTKAVEKLHVAQAAKVARRVRDDAQLELKVDQLRVVDSQLGFENHGVTPPYRLFLSKVDLKVENLSNQSSSGQAKFHLKGAFMGSGATEASGNFHPNAKAADFQVQLRLDQARLTDLNPYFLAEAGVDVAAGQFSAYTELTVKNGKVDGYVKPLIQNLQFYDRKKDKDKRFGKRVEMHVLQFFGNLFRNHSSHDVATVVRISGSTADPKTKQWEVIRKLFGNGFANAILPGFLNKEKPPEKKKP